MKLRKLFVLVLLGLMALNIISANAEVKPLSQTAIPAAQTATLSISDCGVKHDHAGYLYVRHYLWSSIPGYYGTSNYTNFFQATVSTTDPTRYGGDWMAPGTANYVRSSNIQADVNNTTYSYGAAARANTKYADDGFSTIMVSGYIDTDA